MTCGGTTTWSSAVRTARRGRRTSFRGGSRRSPRRPGFKVIKLHEGRHTAASLARDAEVDAEIRCKTLGHPDQRMTSPYTHLEAEAHRAAAEGSRKLAREAGS